MLELALDHHVLLLLQLYSCVKYQLMLLNSADPSVACKTIFETRSSFNRYDCHCHH
jgi:hypothetical protein